MDGTLRLFAALRLPAEWVGDLVGWQLGALAATPRTRLVPPASLHVTLAFLGVRPDVEAAMIAAEVRAAAAGVTLPVRLTPLRYRETRSVGMVELEDEGGRATALAVDVQQRLARLGVYTAERRPWLPHVTVLRFSVRPRLEPAPPAIGPCMPSDAALYHSSLRSGGAQYEVVDSFALGGKN